jgi:polyhydroxyalkanoate synthesis regulator phasin
MPEGNVSDPGISIPVRAPVADATTSVTQANIPTPDKAKLLAEADKRGLLPPDKKAAYEEAKKRGIISMPANTEPMEGNPEALIQTDPKTGVKTLLSTSGTAFEQERDKIVREIRVAQGHEADVDYDSGTNFRDRMALSMMDNDKERQAYLSDQYGAKNVSKDKAGTFYVTTKGKKVAPTGSSVIGDAAADAVGNAPELAMMAKGAEVGARAGIPGAIIGAMVGAVGGKAVQEYEKNVFGYEKKTPEETGRSYTDTAVGAGIGEVLSRPVAASMKGVFTGGVPRWFSGATSESERLTAQTLGMGGVPPMRSVLPSAKTTQFHQLLGEKVAGNLLDKRNLAAVAGEMVNMLKSSGFTAAEIPKAMEIIKNTSVAPSYAAFGSMTKENAQKYEESLVKSVKENMDIVDKSVDEKLRNIRAQTKAIRAGDPALAQQVAESVAQGRKDFSRAMQKGYAQIDHLVGDKPVVPTMLPQRRAKAMLDRMPESDIKPIVKEIAEWKPQETFENMQRMRTRLRELGSPTDLAAKGLTKKDLRELGTLVDASFDRATIGNTPRAVSLLRTMDKTYREGIRKFQDTGINSLVDGMKTGIYPDAQKIVSTVFQRGQSQRAQEIMKLLPEDVRNKVRGEYFNDVMQRAANRTTGEVSGASLSRLVNAPGEDKLMEAAFGSQATKDLKLYAQQLAARDEKIPIDSLQPDRISESIRAAQKAQGSLDKFLDDNFLSELAKPSLPPEKVYQHLVQRGNETQLERAVNFFGPKSPQVQELRKTALVDLMHKAIEPIASGAGKTIGPDALENALGQFTEKQQDLLFPGGMKEDLKSIAESAKFLFPKSGSDMAAGLAAGLIKGTMPFSIVPYGFAAFWNYVLSRPATVKYLALGLNGPGSIQKATIETMRNMVRAGVMGMLPDVGDNSVPDPNEDVP